MAQKKGICDQFVLSFFCQLLMHEEDCGVVAVAFFVCFGHFLVDVDDFAFSEIFENFLRVLLPERDALGVQVAPQNGRVVGVKNHLHNFEAVLVGE